MPTVVFFGAVLLVMSPLPARAADFCAVTVKVSGWDGTPITSTWIELVDPSGRVVRREMVGPEFTICDFGFGPHTLRVGTNECLPVAVSNLRVVIGRPLSLNVVLDACGYRETMRNACLLYFRTVDSDHKPVPDVSFSPRVTTQAVRTDSFGRWQGLFEGSSVFTFTKSGYAPTSVRIQCHDDEELDLEIVMKGREGPNAKQH